MWSDEGQKAALDFEPKQCQKQFGELPVWPRATWPAMSMSVQCWLKTTWPASFCQMQYAPRRWWKKISSAEKSWNPFIPLFLRVRNECNIQSWIVINECLKPHFLILLSFLGWKKRSSWAKSSQDAFFITASHSVRWCWLNMKCSAVIVLQWNSLSSATASGHLEVKCPSRPQCSTPGPSPGPESRTVSWPAF